MTSQKGQVLLLPSPIGNETPDEFPKSAILAFKRLQYFAVENIRTTRRWMKQIDKSINIDQLVFFELNKHTDEQEMQTFLEPVNRGFDLGIVSEAGCAGIADPGAELVRLAHRQQIVVTPHVGPSSILLALMGSGMNGQLFKFHGYLPIKKPAVSVTLKNIANVLSKADETQIFIEAPYRNNGLFEHLLNAMPNHLSLCIACNLNTEEQYILTKSIGAWKKSKKPDLHKKPTVFLIGR